MTWAGELEGWLAHPPTWQLVADDVTAADWLGPLSEATGQSPALTAPLSVDALAALTARRAVASDTKVNLLPAEYLTRYQQQFVDRLWMRGLFAVGAVYMVGVLIYFLVLGVQNFRVGGVEAAVQALGGSYTNTILLTEKHRVLKERADLKFAGLDCWKTVAELMPETARLDNFNFNDGRKLSLKGTCPKADVQQCLDFSSSVRKARVGDKPLFGPGGDAFMFSDFAGAGPGEVTWSFSLELIHTEAK